MIVYEECQCPDIRIPIELLSILNLPGVYNQSRRLSQTVEVVADTTINEVQLMINYTLYARVSLTASAVFILYLLTWVWSRYKWCRDQDG